jgi:hypothetical protein
MHANSKLCDMFSYLSIRVFLECDGNKRNYSLIRQKDFFFLNERSNFHGSNVKGNIHISTIRPISLTLWFTNLKSVIKG